MNQVFYIFRHGETFATKEGVGYGDQILTAGILEEGKPTIEKMAIYLKDIPTDKNISSEINRCRQTAEIVSHVTGKQFVFDERLNEFFMETFESLSQKLTSLLSELKEKQYKHILLCTHGAIIGALLGYFTSNTFEENTIYNYPPPGILTIVKGVQIEQINFNSITS